MTDPREHFEAKIDRAIELITAVQDVINEYHASEPFKFRLERFTNAPRHRMELFVESVQQPPLRVGVLVGEFVHDLRSTLDQLVWQLALTHVPSPSPRLQFPIYEDEPADWASIAGDRLRDVPADAVDMILQAQPFQGDRPQLNALTVVHKLWNEDKHRVILNAVSIPAKPDASHFNVVAEDVAEDVEIETEWGAPLVVGMRLVTVRLTPTGPRPRANIEARAPAEVVFGSMAFRAVAMPQIATAIRQLVRQFADFFD